MCKLSVIIPNYNHGAYLKQRIDSVLNQTYSNIEIIILDDCSPDNSREIIEEYRFHKKVSHIVYNETNSGSTFKQWKKGIELAKGEYIWIAESDDSCEANFLEVAMSGFSKLQTVGISFTQSWVIDSEGALMNLVSDWIEIIDRDRWRKDFINSGKDELKNYLITQNTIFNASAVVFKRKLFEDVFEETNFRLVGDWYLWAKMLMQSDVSYSAMPLNYFRIHNKNVRSTTHQLTELVEVTALIEKLRNNILLNGEKIEIAYRILVARVIPRIIQSSSFTKKQLYAELQAMLYDNTMPKELNSALDAYLKAYNTFFNRTVRRLIYLVRK